MNRDLQIIVPLLIIAALSSFYTFVACSIYYQHAWQREAVLQHKATYTITSAGDAKWVWLP